ncbi:Stk1 family PASTA domain-containing Ser/Thr kinase [Streptomyces sp. NPDC053048]|uniref:Stk1 family PASTA domain-containing Ser/Thr kinase n=1 Tax=Streptomyces sp. NPDC053048 TaxID=3365694 RepID=UPI0037D095FC
MDTTLPDPLVDHLLDGRYRVEARVAVGGMATVYRALDTRLDRVLALKVMHPSLAADRAFVERFIREAKSVARLDHANVVSVFDQGTDGHYVYLAMEYVAGCTLRDVLRERGALRPRAALDVAEPVLAALGAAHVAGLVHRDMKPENVLIGDDGRVKVADFGLVRAVDTHTTSSTGSVLGTVAYLAPEQIEQSDQGAVDTRADVYACGVVLYEMLTGAKPHTGGTAAQILYQHLHEDVPPPSAAVPGLAPQLDALVAAATARDPRLRPSDAVELLAMVREARAALTDEQLDAAPPAAAPAPEQAGPEDATSVIPRVPAAADDATSVLPRVLPAQAADVHHTTRLETPPAPSALPSQAPPPPRGLARRLPHRWILVAAAALLAVLAGTGVWYINSGQFTTVPAVLDMPQGKATTTLEKAGLGVKSREEFSETVERGHVMSTDPKPGDRIRNTGKVTLTVSRGPQKAEVPNVVGMPLDQAKRKIEAQGLTVGEVGKQFSDETPKGSVLATDPKPGVQRRPDSAVALVVSQGKQLNVPDVTGQPVAAATSALRDAGFQVEVANEQVFSDRPQGAVAQQSPGKGTQAAEGDTVTLVVSKGKEMIAVPDVTGKSEAEARRILTGAGFGVKVERPFLFPKDSVESQSVRAGERAAKGDTIVVRMKSGF